MRFSEETPGAAGQRQVNLAFGIELLQRDSASEAEDIFARVFSATVSGLGCETSRTFFEDNYIIIDFPRTPERPEKAPIGSITCIENSSGTDCGIIIDIRADGLLESLMVLSPYPVDFAGETELFATLALSFALHPEDGNNGEHVVENMLNGPPRPILRVELSDGGAPSRT